MQLGITFEFVNIGGGLGIPYRPTEVPWRAFVALSSKGSETLHRGRACRRLWTSLESRGASRRCSIASLGFDRAARCGHIYDLDVLS